MEFREISESEITKLQDARKEVDDAREALEVWVDEDPAYGSRRALDHLRKAEEKLAGVFGA